MLKVIRRFLLIIFMLIIVTGSAAFSAIINHYQPVNREAIGETIGRAAYDRVKGIRGKIISYEPTDYILNNETNTDIIIELHLLNIDVTRYFNKTVKEYTFQIMKHVWSIPFDVTVVAVDDKILRLYYSKKKYGNYGYYTKLYALDGKHFKGVNDEQYLKLVKEFNQKWEEYITMSLLIAK